MIKRTIFAHEIHMANRNDISFPVEKSEFIFVKI